MQYDVKTPAEYLEKLEDDWRKEKIEQVRKMILCKDSSIREGINYKMLSYEMLGNNIFHLNAQRAYVSLYVGNIEKVDKSQELLSEFNVGKGCIRIKRDIQLEHTRLEEFISKTIELWRKGGSTEC